MPTDRKASCAHRRRSPHAEAEAPTELIASDSSRSRQSTSRRIPCGPQRSAVRGYLPPGVRVRPSIFAVAGCAAVRARAKSPCESCEPEMAPRQPILREHRIPKALRRVARHAQNCPLLARIERLGGALHCRPDDADDSRQRRPSADRARPQAPIDRLIARLRQPHRPRLRPARGCPAKPSGAGKESQRPRYPRRSPPDRLRLGEAGTAPSRQNRGRWADRLPNSTTSGRSPRRRPALGIGKRQAAARR